MTGRNATHRRSASGAWRMHEWPLVVFTALAIPAAGLSAARLVLDTLGVLHGQAEDTVIGTAIALLVGLAVSLAHLGRVERAHLALKRVGRNALSTEVALATALVCVAGTALVPGLPVPLRLFLVRAAGVLGAALLIALGLVYYLPARRPWRGPLVAAPLVSGMAMGMILLAWEEPSSATRTLALLLLLADTAICAPAWASHRLTDGFAPVHRTLFGHRMLLVLPRFALFDLVPAASITAWPGLAVFGGLVGLLIDRLAFYALATNRTTEAEIARIERLIESAGAPNP